jgi:hypothetical protein
MYSLFFCKEEGRQEVTAMTNITRPSVKTLNHFLGIVPCVTVHKTTEFFLQKSSDVVLVEK